MTTQTQSAQQDQLRQAAMESKAWPFEEARKILERIQGKTPEKGYVLFETGYGPSGLPHIGTFGEVARTTMVRHAFQTLSDIPTKMYCVSDDMDGLRKVPSNIPNPEIVEKHLGKPLTQIPDPFGTHDSFGAHNNARLQKFLDSFDFEYEFVSATECYKSGRYDPMLLKVLENYDEIINVILPTLGPERKATYSPFLPLCPKTGIVLQVPIIDHDVKAGTVSYKDEDGNIVVTPVTGGHCKLQWKADWGMRWAAFDVDYEMAGKDLIDSVKLSSRIAKILGNPPPEGFNYELFLDADGTKISKSKGNGLTIEEWLEYAPAESLEAYLFQSPRKAKRLYFDVIPRQVDDYLTFLNKFDEQTIEQRLSNPVWHIHGGKPPKEELPISFGILLNLASVCNTEDKSVLWGFIMNYSEEASPEKMPLLDHLVGYALKYYTDFVKPNKIYRKPTDQERAAMEDLVKSLPKVVVDPLELQTEVYEVGKRHGFENLRDWFKSLYEVLFGQSEGPRMGSFIALYGVDAMIKLIEDKLAES